ncbi:MAG: DUF4340 domain-containing protein, partial [Acidobacteriota bacterium]|nr:DUF4340 domain-containing protein [Acidobacteriota bacterium]
MQLNTKLAALVALLLAGSIFAYASSTSRGDRFQRGQRLLPNLIPDEVASIVITKGQETTTLRRSAEKFTIAEAQDYPAKNESVNRFLRDLLEIELAKEIGSSAGLAEELEIDPMTEETVEVVLANASGQEMVRLRVGKAFQDGAGRYVRRLDMDDAPIYLSADSTYLSTGSSSFIEKEIVDHSQSQVQRVEGPGFVIAAEDAESPLKLQDVADGRKEKSVETNKLKSILDRLSFDEVFL